MDAATAPSPAAARARFPAWVLVVAAVAALVHILPALRAALVAPDGVQFTGNLSGISPDAMQYRAWYRHTALSGPIAENRFTTEPNLPHLPLVWFWLTGQVATLLGVDPEFVALATGAITAFVLSLLVFEAVRRLAAPPGALR